MGVGLEGPLWDVLPGSGEAERDRQAEGAGRAQRMGESEVITPRPGAGPRVPRQTLPWLHLEQGLTWVGSQCPTWVGSQCPRCLLCLTRVQPRSEHRS